MREILYQSKSPLSISIAADPRINSTDYLDDQIWELTINAGEPQALAVQTTYGLRASNMRLFPRFTIGNEESTNPQKFTKPPTFQKIFPNFIGLSFSPIKSISVQYDLWVPRSQVISGRIVITNISSQNQRLKFELIALLNPSEGGSRIIPVEIDGVRHLFNP